MRSIPSAVYTDSASPAVLRIGLSANARVAGLQLRILKRRGASCERSLSLAIPRPLAWSRLPIAEVLAQPSTRPAPRLRAVPQP